MGNSSVRKFETNLDLDLTPCHVRGKHFRLPTAFEDSINASGEYHESIPFPVHPEPNGQVFGLLHAENPLTVLRVLTIILLLLSYGL